MGVMETKIFAGYYKQNIYSGLSQQGYEVQFLILALTHRLSTWLRRSQRAVIYCLSGPLCYQPYDLQFAPHRESSIDEIRTHRHHDQANKERG